MLTTSVLLILVLAAPRCYPEPVPGSSKLSDSNDRQERHDVNRSFRPENGSLNENLVYMNKSLMARIIDVNRHRNLKNKEIKVDFKTLLSADLKPEQKIRQGRKKRSKGNTKDKAKFTPSYVVFILELIMVLMSNLCTHMIRIYKNSVPQVKLNIIIVISHYIVELANIFIIFQVVFNLIHCHRYIA